ncbi:hypothetical protein QTH97_36790 [Variovorax sp. J22R24]|uniref:hypothetical protein n=1 Tax=Variovorax gracilis TaxID=3053502 RepID=UPI002576E21A|nr:hypothetical protein [Variovorax sp. J22R24]MDM0110483.1 hypothetical protein [Variovorax sp. J22R24]
MNPSQPRVTQPQGAPYMPQAAATSGGPSRPSFGPAAAAAAGAKAGCGCGGATADAPRGPSPAALATMSASSPSIRPASAGAAVGATAWHQNVRITALWSINEERNAFAHLENIGWRKLASHLHSAHLALNLLASHARQAGGVNSLREEDDGMLHEMYVW